MRKNATFLYATVLCLSIVSRVHAQWASVAEMPAKYVPSLAVSGTTVFAASDINLFRSTDGGITWSLVKITVEKYAIPVIAHNGAAFFAGTWNGIYRSIDDGASWLPVGFVGGSRSIFINGLATFGGTNLMALSMGGGLLRSTDNGETWAHARNGPAYYDLTSIAADGAMVLAGTEEPGGVYRSVDSGATWTSIKVTAIKDDGVANVAVFGTTLLANMYGRGLFRSTDNGMNWTPSSTGLPAEVGYAWLGYRPINAFIQHGAAIFAGSADGVFVSTDRGETWTSVSAGLGRSKVLSLAIVGSILLAGTEDGGIWRRPLSEIITSAPEMMSGELPARFILYQNYPNPFNPSTGIRYQVPFVSEVRLSVYDVLGREVALLVNEVKQPGSYTVQFDGSRLASSTYFYQLSAGSYVDTKKFMLLR